MNNRTPNNSKSAGISLAGFLAKTITVVLLVLIYSVIAMQVLPDGINVVFVERLSKWLSGLLSMLVLALIAYRLIAKGKNFTRNKKLATIRISDFCFALIPLTPVVRYLIANQQELALANMVVVFAIFALISIVFCVIVPVLVSIFTWRYVAACISASFLFVIFNMPSLIFGIASSKQDPFTIQILVFIAAIFILLVARLIPRAILNVMVIAFFIISGINEYLRIEGDDAIPVELADIPIVNTVEGKPIKYPKDIFLLIHEAYAAYETMLHYGYDNREQIEYLEDKGFHIYHGIYTLGVTTVSSMGMVFNVNRDISPSREYVAGGGAVHIALSRHGYKTYGIFCNSYIFRGLPKNKIKYDYPFPGPVVARGSSLIIGAILTGEFTDKVSLEGVGYQPYQQQKRSILQGNHPKPVFAYSHDRYPGHRGSTQQDPDQEEEETLKYLENLKIANAEMRQDVALLLKHNPDALVIIAGDHGPFLTKSGFGVRRQPDNYKANDIDRYDMQDRKGIFLAIRWPDKDYAQRYEIKIFQDIFPAVFSCLFDDDSLFDKTRIQKRETIYPHVTLGVYVQDGIIIGGKNDGEALFQFLPYDE